MTRHPKTSVIISSGHHEHVMRDDTVTVNAPQERACVWSDMHSLGIVGQSLLWIGSP